MSVLILIFVLVTNIFLYLINFFPMDFGSPPHPPLVRATHALYQNLHTAVADLQPRCSRVELNDFPPPN